MSEADTQNKVSKGLSIDPDLHTLAVRRAESLGMTFSEYVVRVLERDIDDGGEFVIKPKTVKGEDW